MTRTVALHARQLSTGMVIRDPHGNLHTITELTTVPGTVVVFFTDTGRRISADWYAPGAEYDVVAERWGTAHATAWDRDGADAITVHPTYRAARTVHDEANATRTWADLDAGDCTLLLVDRGRGGGWTVRRDPRLDRARVWPAGYFTRH